MASLNGITCTPDTGNGDVTLTVTAAPYSGRADNAVKFTAANPTSGLESDNSLVVVQKGKTIFSFTGPLIDSSVTEASISAETNLQSLKATSVGGTKPLWDYLDYAIVNEVRVEKAALINGYTVPDDPGEKAAYNVSFCLSGIPDTVDDTEYIGEINGAYSVNLIKRGTGVIPHNIWFSNGRGASQGSTLEVKLNSDGEIIGAVDNPYINTDQEEDTWGITPTQNS